MKKRRNTKAKRCIILLIKGSVFLLICLVGLFIMKNMKPKSKTISYDVKDDSVTPTNRTCMISLRGLSQEKIPTGCESVSTVAVLQHLGIDITIDEFINDYLPRESFYRNDGILYGPNPNESFAGDPYSKNSLGCYPPVILKALEHLKTADYPGSRNLLFGNISGTDFDTLISRYIDRNIPVILWVTIDMKEPYAGMQYHLETGEIYTWTAQEHCVVLCGYDEENYYLMDPLQGGQIVARKRNVVEQRYVQMGKHAVVIY